MVVTWGKNSVRGARKTAGFDEGLNKKMMSKGRFSGEEEREEVFVDKVETFHDF